VTTHPLYENVTFGFDVAVLTLAQEAPTFAVIIPLSANVSWESAGNSALVSPPHNGWCARRTCVPTVDGMPVTVWQLQVCQPVLM
jgi:hypothetical protein